NSFSFFNPSRPERSQGMTIKASAVEPRAWLGAANLAAVRQVWLARLAWEEQRLPRRPGDLRQREQPADRLRRMIRDGWRVPCAKRQSVPWKPGRRCFPTPVAHK